MKFLIGYNEDSGFLVGELRFDNYFSFSCDCLLPYRESDINCYDIAAMYWNNLSAEDKLYLCELNNCSPLEMRKILRSNKRDLIHLNYEVDYTTMPKINDDVFFDLISCGQHDPREDDPDLFIPKTLFDRIMTAWDNYHLKNSCNSKEEYDALVDAISVCGFDNKETWCNFVLEKIK